VKMRTTSQVLADLDGDLNPDPTTRAHGDVFRPEKGRGRQLGTPRGQSVTHKPAVSPGVERYDPTVGVLPRAEIRRLLVKWLTTKTGPLAGRGDQYTIREIARLAVVHDVCIDRLKYDLPGAVFPPQMSRVSQVLLRIEAHLIVKTAGTIEILNEPRDPPRPPITRRVVIDWRGRVSLAPGESPPAPRPFPTMMKSWILG